MNCLTLLFWCAAELGSPKYFSTIELFYIGNCIVYKYIILFLVIPANSADLTPQVPAVGNIVLLPPAGSTNVPKFTAPIIVPAMSPTDPNCPNNTGTAAPVGVATNPINNTRVNTAEDEDGTPDFDNDDQLLNFVSSRLWRVLKDCGTSMQVCSGVSTRVGIKDVFVNQIQISLILTLQIRSILKYKYALF